MTDRIRYPYAPAPDPCRQPEPSYLDQPGAPAPRRSRLRLVSLALATGLLAGSAGGVVGARVAAGDDVVPPTPPSTAVRTSAPGTVSDIAAAVLPSVVSVKVQGANGSSSGSGVILDTAGHILTNNHVVAPGAGGKIRVVFNDGRSADAEIVGRDPVSDEVTGFPPLTVSGSPDPRTLTDDGR